MSQPVTTNPFIIMLINMTVVFLVLIALGVVINLIHYFDPTKPKAKPAEEAPAPAPPKSQLSDTASEEASKSSEPEMGQVRENLEETAFFMPAIVTDNQGILALKFRLPESVTTWQFMGLATDRDANSGRIGGESVAQKEVMVVPNVPRFVRVGDKAQVSARVINTSDHKVEGKARMLLIDPEDESVCYEQEVKVSIPANQTQAVTFQFQPEAGKALLVCRVMASGEGFSDGEQHYLPVLPVGLFLLVTAHGVGYQQCRAVAVVDI